MAVAMIGPKFYAWDRNGKPLAFGKLYTYQARTNVPKPTYQSEDQVVENTNPVILNGEGYANIYLDGSYKMVLKDNNENEIWSSDPVTSNEAHEWTNCMTAVYGSSTSFIIAGNVTSEYEVGRSVQIDDGTTSYSYSRIKESFYLSGETTITVQDPVVTTSIKTVCVSIVGPNSLPGSYGFIFFDSVSDMIEGNPVITRTGDRCNTGGTNWDVISVSEPRVLGDFKAITPVYASDLGIDGVSDNSDAFEELLNLPYPLVVDVDVNLTRNIVRSENTEIDINFIGNSKVLQPGYAPRLRSNPEHRITSTYKREFIDKTSFDDSKHEQAFAIDGVSQVDNSIGNFKNMVTAYFGADSLNATEPRIWAINTVTNVHEGHSGLSEAYGYELDVNIDIGIDYSLIDAPIAGLYLAGAGDLSNVASNVASAIWIRRTGGGSYLWKEGVKLQECVDGIVMDDSIGRHLLLAFKTDSSYKHVPLTTNGAAIFEVWNPANTQLITAINNDGSMTLPKIGVGGGLPKTFESTYFAPSVGSGNIPAQSSVDLLFTSVFGSQSIDWGKSEITVTPSNAGALSAGLIVTAYVDTAAGDAKIRLSNITNAQINNFAIDLRAFVRSF